MASDQGTCYFFYQKGYCKWGNRCRYQHELPPPATPAYGRRHDYYGNAGGEQSIPSAVFNDPSLVSRFAELTMNAYTNAYGSIDATYSSQAPRYPPAGHSSQATRRSPPMLHLQRSVYGHQSNGMQHGYNNSWNGSGGYGVPQMPTPPERVVKKRIFTPVGTPVLKAFLDEDLALFKEVFSGAEIGVDPFTRTISIVAEADVVEAASKELQAILDDRKRVLRHHDRALTSTALGTVRFAVGSGLNVTELYEPVHFERIRVIDYPMKPSVENIMITFGSFGNPVEVAVHSVNKEHQTKELYVIFERHGEALNSVKGLSQTFLCTAHGIPMCSLCSRQTMAISSSSRFSAPFMQVHVELDIARLQRINLFCCATIELGLSDTPDIVPDLLSDLGLPPALEMHKSAEYDHTGRYVVSVKVTTARTLYASILVTTSMRGQVPFNITFGAPVSYIPIPSDLYERLRTLIDTMMDLVEKQFGVDAEWSQEANAIVVSGASEHDRLSARGKLKSVFSQSRIPLHPRLVSQLAFLSSEIQSWEELSGAYLSINYEARTTCSVGTFDARNALALLIDNFFSNPKKKLVHRKISLAPRVNECARMIARRYADVQDKYNVDIIYSHPDQSITLEGTQDTVAAAEAMIEKIFNSVLDSVEEQSTRPKQGPYCVLCNHGVSDGFTLEVCGHSYCWDCLRFVARTALHAGREVKCAQCEDPLLSTEVYKFMSTTECSDKSTAHRRALERALNAGASNFCRCLTANCPGVWKKEASTLVWRCNSCLAAYCWSCKTDYETDEFGLSHLGKSCESYQLKRSQLAHRQSHARDQSCPLCLEPLSKLIGSNLSLCGACSAEVCCSCTNDKTRFGCDVGTCRRISDVTTASSTTE